MILKDKIDFQGHFSVKIFKKDGTIEVYEDKNLIMDSARSNMAALVGGYTIGEPIGRFVLGNKGHNAPDILDYKKVGQDGEFVATRDSLFSEDPAYAAEGGVDSFVYEIGFDCIGPNTTATDIAAVGNILGSTDTHQCQVDRLVNERTCTYTIAIPDYAGNKLEEGAVIAYTEAALYAGGNIFSMKTFPARVKEDTVKFEITWSIIF